MVNPSSRVTALAADETKQLQTQFISILKSELRTSPVASNMVIGLILTGLERIVEVEFACPCDPEWNTFFGSVYLILPGVTASVLMLVIHECKCRPKEEHEKLSLSGPVPLIMWLILVFLDGQYYACARTDWTGRFVIVDKGEPQKWCEPPNGTLYMERMSLTQTWYFQSQAFGFGILLVCVLLFGAYKCLRTQPTDEKDQDEEEPNIGSAFELTEASQENRL